MDFEALSPNRTRVNLQLYYDPDGFIESAADAPGVLSDQVQTDLESSLKIKIKKPVVGVAVRERVSRAASV